jgi:hypothetical protein
MNANDKKSQAGVAFVESLTEGARRALMLASPSIKKPTTDIEDDAEMSGSDFLASLTAATRAAFKARRADTSVVAVVPKSTAKNKPNYCLVEADDGEWPKLHRFKSAVDMAKYIRKLEGRDVVIWPLFGVPLSISDGPQRYLILPNDNLAITIPMFDGAECKLVSLDTLELTTNESGYLGPPELRTPMSAHEKAHADSEDDDS